MQLAVGALGCAQNELLGELLRNPLWKTSSHDAGAARRRLINKLTFNRRKQETEI
jgi:hypothetical protein